MPYFAVLCRVLRALARNMHLIFGVRLAGKSLVDSVGNVLTRASVNTGISKFSVENSDEKKLILWEGMIYLGLSWLVRVCVDQDS